MNTRRTFIQRALAMLLALPPFHSFAQAPKRISLEELEAMFSSMRANTKWNVSGPLMWGYFFFDPSLEKLKKADAELEALGYRTVNLGKVDGQSLFRLHVEKVEAHTPASLNARNAEFYALAEKLGIASYDGMDVGPVPATSP